MRVITIKRGSRELIAICDGTMRLGNKATDYSGQIWINPIYQMDHGWFLLLFMIKYLTFPKFKTLSEVLITLYGNIFTIHKKCISNIHPFIYTVFFKMSKFTFQISLFFFKFYSLTMTMSYEPH